MARHGLAVLLALATVACELSPPARAAGYGFRSQPDSLVFRWQADRMPVKYWVESKGALPDYVDEGIRLWEAQFLYGEFDGSRVTDSATADVRVFLPRESPPAAALSTAPPVEACSGEFNMIFDLNNRLTLPVSISLQWFDGFSAGDVANCLARVTAHEIGHSLGLLQHSDRDNDIMRGAPFGFVRARGPSSRDRATVQTLYHTAPHIRP